MTVTERLLKYIAIHTQSAEDYSTVPTTSRQFDLANILVEDLKAIGASDVRVDDKCYVYATIPATKGLEDKISVGFIAHMDTSPDFSGENVKPQIIENYDCTDVALGDSGRVLEVATFPHLKDFKGRTLITTDGTTLLGADDKAGIAEILTLAQELIEKDIPHGKVCIAFTPDEEVGTGADCFDVPNFGAEVAYTCDGDTEGCIEFENFNAAGVKVEITGFNVHPGTAKNTMINAGLVAMEFNSMLPTGQTPRDTEDYEGFFHLTEIKGEVAEAQMSYIIRDHSPAGYDTKIATVNHIAKLLNEKYGKDTVKVTIKAQYRNMREQVEPFMHLIHNAKKAAELAGVTPEEKAIRGGTDGATLSFMGLPCPNIGTGGHSFHGPYEHITVEGMEKAVDILVNIVKLYAE